MRRTAQAPPAALPIRPLSAPAALAALAALAACLLCLGCAGSPPYSDPRLQAPVDEAPYVQVVEGEGVRAEIVVPPGQDPDEQTYILDLEQEDGPAQTIEHERRGEIVRLWLTDLGPDGSPDLLVSTLESGAGVYGHIHLFERRGDMFFPRPLDPLALEQMVGYRGRDKFAVRGGRLYRSHPVYEPDDVDDAPSGGTAHFVYDFRTDTWVGIEP